jgi:hypothetical protein
MKLKNARRRREAQLCNLGNDGVALDESIQIGLAILD